MAKRQKKWARKVRDSIFNLLGRVCIKCGATEKLEFDIIVPVGNNDHHKKMDWSWRMSFYKRQLEIGNLQILCAKCNQKKQNNLELQHDIPLIEQPF